jgi:hypothetical protein
MLRQYAGNQVSRASIAFEDTNTAVKHHKDEEEPMLVTYQLDRKGLY